MILPLILVPFSSRQFMIENGNTLNNGFILYNFFCTCSEQREQKYNSPAEAIIGLISEPTSNHY